MKQPGLLLQTGLLVAVLGMTLVVLGVIVGPLFYPGVFVLMAGQLLCAWAGIIYTLSADDARIA